jgi:phytoene dehydrogenase-like protein
VTSYDAVVIGSGPNGLVAANHLADAGWSVLVLEEQPDVGGAVRSANDVHPDFVHDTFSAFYPLAAASPWLRAFQLEEHGLSWTHAPAVLGHPLRGGEWALLDRDRELTAGWFEDAHLLDGQAWLELCGEWDVIGEHIIKGLLTPFPPVKAGIGGLLRLRRAGGLQFVKTLLTPALELGRHRFKGEGPRVLLAGNAGHSDIPLDAPGSGLMALMMSMLAQTVGFPVPEGGAGQLTQALASRLRSLGGEIRSESPVEHIGVSHGRARTVHTAGGESYEAGRAIVATVVAPHLYGDLLDPADVPNRVRRGMKAFELDPSTIKVDWALSGPVPWQSPPVKNPGTLHIADNVTDMAQSLGQVSAGLIPAKPFMLAGQMTTTDPTRSPDGTESMWAYTHVPQQARGDAGEEGLGESWGRDELERFADRMQARFEQLAPGFGSRVLERRILGPADLESRDANLIGGAINGGTSQLHQELVFRPVPGLGRAETGISGLYLGGASAHPGGGVHGAAGNNAARAAIAHDRVRRMTGRRG